MKESFPQQQNNHEKKKFNISKEDGYEVLENLEINEKNQEFAQKMADIENELKSRSYLKAELSSDTGEIIKPKGPSQFEGVKKELVEEAKKTLTHPSKYIKGAVIAGLIATGIATDILYSGPIEHAIHVLSHSVTTPGSGSFDTMVNTLEASEVVAFVALTARTIQQGIKSISQTIKTKLVGNQKMQRYVALLAGGVDENLAKKVVNSEANRIGGYERSGEKEFHSKKDYRGYYWTDQSTEAKKQINTVRKTLDDMGIKRIDRLKYADKKERSYF